MVKLFIANMPKNNFLHLYHAKITIRPFMLKPKVIDFPNTMLEITYINTINSISARMEFVYWAIIFFYFFL